VAKSSYESIAGYLEITCEFTDLLCAV